MPTYDYGQRVDVVSAVNDYTQQIQRATTEVIAVRTRLPKLFKSLSEVGVDIKLLDNDLHRAITLLGDTSQALLNRVLDCAEDYSLPLPGEDNGGQNASSD